ncbi:hypothetical protein LRP50_00145 [Enterovibrio sp. ZSDZ42]|uniref:Uncharacterized protein n=1 Tax=Enterovibrio gelatinilyticus TaxID=2899819 RepID=A0ABT5QU48_9GAMM|nr:hypothetical protein [Enterovibrio sp. ZSDZ42]MDD1791537.1 hypothetical protein [Enterovibrio sp. ZSDZ42]
MATLNEPLVASIEKRKQWIVDERQRLEEYAKAQAKRAVSAEVRGNGSDKGG